MESGSGGSFRAEVEGQTGKGVSRIRGREKATGKSEESGVRVVRLFLLITEGRRCDLGGLLGQSARGPLPPGLEGSLRAARRPRAAAIRAH